MNNSDNREVIEINNQIDLINLFIIKKNIFDGSFIYDKIDIINKIININNDFDFNYNSDTIVDTNFPTEINLINTTINGNGKVLKNLQIKKIGQQYKSFFNTIDKDSIIDNLIFDNLIGFLTNNNKGIIKKCYFKNMTKKFPFNDNKYSFIIDGNNDGTISDCVFSNIIFNTDRDKVINNDVFNGISVVCDINNGTIDKCSFENININSNKASIITFNNKSLITNCVINGENVINTNYEGTDTDIVIGGLVSILNGGRLQNIDIKGRIKINGNNYGLLCNSIVNGAIISCITINYTNNKQLVNINAKGNYKNEINNIKKINNIYIVNNAEFNPIYEMQLTKDDFIKIDFNNKECSLYKKNDIIIYIITIIIFICIILFLICLLFSYKSQVVNSL